MTFREHLHLARTRLAAAGVPAAEAALDAELLARHLLGQDRAAFVANLRETAPAGFAAAYADWIERRAAREPVAYIRGVQEFWGRDFVVGPGVLIPRPETELIIEEALAGPRPERVLDIGTGSGCLAITLAIELAVAGEAGGPVGDPALRLGDPKGSPLQDQDRVEATLQGRLVGTPHHNLLVIGTDPSAAALELARRNATRLLGPAHADRLTLVQGADAAGVEGPFDLIVSNPPYVTAAEYAVLEPEVRVHEPALALVGGDDGLQVIRGILDIAPARLTANGRLLMEIGHDQAEAVTAAIAADPRLHLVRIREDLQGIPRVMVVERRALDS